MIEGKAIYIKRNEAEWVNFANKLLLMKITVSKNVIFKEVEKRSSLEGSMIPERFEGVWASEEEGQFLDSYWVEGYTAIVQLLKKYLSTQTVNYDLSTYDKDEVLSIEVEMPGRYSSLLDGSVNTDVNMLMVCNILTGWFGVKHPEAAAKYDEEAKGYTEDLRVKLLYRTEPTGTMNAPKMDDTAIEHDCDSLEQAKMDDTAIYPNCEFIGRAKMDMVAMEQRPPRDCLIHID